MWWFDGWSDVLQVVLVGVAAYASLVLLIRASGKRSLAQMNAFDLVVTVALGSTLATILLSADVSLAEGVAAIVVLLGLQVLVAVLVVRSRRFRRTVTATAVLLASDGELDEDALRRERMTSEDVMQALREQGFGDPAQVAAVVLESDGQLSVVSVEQLGDGSALANVRGWGS